MKYPALSTEVITQIQALTKKHQDVKVAEMLGLSQATISKYKNGKLALSFETRMKLFLQDLVLYEKLPVNVNSQERNQFFASSIYESGTSCALEW